MQIRKKIKRFLVNYLRLEDVAIKVKREKISRALITGGARNPGEIADVDKLSDNERWLLCSEGRPVNMQFAVLEPKV